VIPVRPLARLLTLLALVVTSALFLLAPLAQAAAPDPLAAGPYGIVRQDYEAGSIRLQMPSSPGAPATAQREEFTQYLRGDLFYPSGGSGPFPVIVNVHGNHSACRTTALPLGTGESSAYADDCTRDITTGAPVTGFSPLPNDEGYDYIAANLASHGYVVISVDQDEMMVHQVQNPGDDRGMYSRSQIIAAHLDALSLANQGLAAGNLPAALAGRLDMSSIGLMGHSRGGEAVTHFIDYNRTRPGPRYNLKAVLSIAPVDYERRAPYGTNYATVLPLCDGDVSNVQGARFFERSQHIAPGDPFPRIQFTVQGADHNYFNTSWVADDGAGYSRAATLTDGNSTNIRDLACGEKNLNSLSTAGVSVPSSIRLSPTDQQKAGLAIEAAFMRRFAGGETAFDPYMTGSEPFPASACASPGATGVSCSEEFSTNYFDAPAGRLDVIEPGGDQPLTVDAAGGALTGSGFSNPFKNPDGTAPANGYTPAADTSGGYDWCNPEPLQFVGTAQNPPKAAKPCPLPALDGPGGQANERENAPVNRSYGNQLALAWDRPASLAAQLPARAGNVSGFTTLALSAAVNYFDTRNVQRTPGNASDPRAVSQDFDVVLVDDQGHEATVPAGAAKYGSALEPSLGAVFDEGGKTHRGRRHVVLKEVRIPLTDFGGVDLQHVAQVELRFGGRTATGSIQLADVRFQEGTYKDATVDLSKYPAQAPPADQIVGDVTLAAPGVLPSGFTAAGACADLAPPVSSVTTVTATRNGYSAKGKATDTGCGASAPKKVYVAFTRKGAKVSYATATGTQAWSRASRRTLKRGTYVLRVRATDAAGNLAGAVSRTVTVR